MSICYEKLISAFGLALRAGKCSVGTERCVVDIRAHYAKLVIVPEDISDNTKKRIYSAVSFHGVPIIELPCSKSTLGERLGKTGGISCAAVTDEGFVKIVEKIYGEIHTGHTEVQQ